MRFLNQQLSLVLAVIVACNTSSVLGERWSRQLMPNLPATGNDWVPIRNGKSLSYGEDLTPAAQTQFQFFAEPQNNRFNLQQTHPGHPAASPQDISSFSSQNAPPFQFFNSQKQRTVQTFGGPISNKPIAEPLVQNPPPFQYMQEIQRGPHVHHYQSQPIPKSLQNFQQGQHVPPFTQLSGQHRVPQFQNLASPPQFQPAPTPQFQPAPTTQYQTLQGEQQQPQSEEQVQLLYVPFDSLYQQNQQPQRETFDGKTNRFNLLNQPVSASLINDFYSQNEVQEIPTKAATTKKPVSTKRPTSAPVTLSLRATTPFDFNKPKPHQPPLSMFVAIDKFKGKATEADVLSTLKNSNSIDVMDSISKNSPKVFIGPSGMEPPLGYSKFDLPYLSSIEGSRTERRIEQLPFFVAPLSYRTPPGFSKIPLPAPHVGSVVVNQPPNTIESNESNGFTQDNYYTKQPAAPTVQLGQQSNLNSNQASKTQKVTLTSGFNYSPEGIQLIRNEYSFPTLSPSSGTSLNQESQSRSVYTTPRSTFAQTVPQSTAAAPLTKVAYKQIEEKRNYGHSTLSPTTTRAPATKTKLDYFPSSPRSTARGTTTTLPYVELEEHKTVNEEYYGFEKEKKPSFSFSFGAETEKPAKNFNFRPIPDFDFGETDYVTTKKPKIKTTTAAPVLETQKSVSQFTFNSPTPTPSFDYSPTVSIIENTNEFGQVNGGSEGNFFEYRSSPRPTSQDYTHNRFNIRNEQTYTQDNAYTPQQYVQDISEDIRDLPESVVNNEEAFTTENPSYSLPSELPSISPQLPEAEITTTSTTTTRRPINRGSRRPVTSTYRSTATESTAERRPVTRSRRPSTQYTSRNSVATTEASFPSRSESSFPSRSTATVSRGSKGKYNVTSEDRSRFRTRNRTPTSGKKEEENIDYQRDVLNQNYPVVSPASIKIANERHEDNNQELYHTEAPIPDHSVNDYNAPLESVEVIPLGVPTTQATIRQTTQAETVATESPIPRRTNFPRRRLHYTTTDSPTTSSDDTTESTNGRTRGRKENVVVVKKVRGRVRLTTTESPETTRRTIAVRTRTAYNRNKETTRDNNQEENKPRFRIRENTPRFKLDTQESQWSSRFNQNSFQPFDDEKSKTPKDDEVDDEQEIVTASPSSEKDTYLFNVTASVAPTKPAESVSFDESINMISTTEKDEQLGKRTKNEDELGSSFEKFVKDVLEDIEDEGKSEAKTEKKSIGTEKKTTPRRGVWKRIKVRPADGFETAETQYVGKQLYNSLPESDKKEGEKQEVTTTKHDDAEPTEIVSTKDTPLEHVFSETTTVEPEVEESKGMFDEARKALTELFSTEEDSDDAVNMEDADDKLEALRDSTTTQIPTTDETTTIIPTIEATTLKPVESVVSSSKQVKTSTSQKVTGEICYRGRCIKTDEKK